MTERRYDEAEVAEIFQRATEVQHGTTRAPLAHRDGMTVGELQAIGREVGIAPELIAQAARSIDRAGKDTSRTMFGLPVGVGRIVDLGRRISDSEWERLIVDLRDTFDARGRIRDEGSFRQWTNGNLQALLEPTESGHRLRLKTFKGDASGYMFGGLALLGAAAVMLVSSMTGGDAAAWSRVLPVAAMGAGVFGLGALRLPSWARLRRRQMREITERLTARLESGRADE